MNPFQWVLWKAVWKETRQPPSSPKVVLRKSIVWNVVRREKGRREGKGEAWWKDWGADNGFAANENKRVAAWISPPVAHRLISCTSIPSSSSSSSSRLVRLSAHLFSSHSPSSLVPWYTTYRKKPICQCTCSSNCFLLLFSLSAIYMVASAFPTLSTFKSLPNNYSIQDT